MTFRFGEDEAVVLKEGLSDFLPTGIKGVIFCQYATLPPAYEVNFRDANGEEFGTVVYEDELESLRSGDASPVREAVGAA